MRELLILLASVLGLSGPGGAGSAGAPEHPVRLTVAASGDFLIHAPVAQRALAIGGGEQCEQLPHQTTSCSSITP